MSIIRQLARVANRIDSASTGTFLSKGDSTGDFTTVNYTDLSGRPTTLDSAALTSIVDSAYIQLRQTSAGSGGLDSAAITALVDSNYVVARSPAASSGFAQYEYTATAGQTTFQDSDINGNVMSYTADGIFVFYNGVLIAPTTDYTASDGSSVVLTTGADSGSHVAISKWSITSGGSSGSSYSLGGDRGLYGGGRSSTQINTIDYVDITTPGNATDFGDLVGVVDHTSSLGDGTYGVWAGGYTGSTQTSKIDYVTVATPANAGDFGDLTISRERLAACCDGTYGLMGGGSVGTLTTSNNIDYITVASTGNATTFGNLGSSTGAAFHGSFSDGTYGVWGGGNGPTAVNVVTDIIWYVTTATPADATDFGDLTITKRFVKGTSDETYGLFVGGTNSSNAYLNEIDYVTIASPGNATDFGDLTTQRSKTGAASNGTYGVFAGGQTSSANENNTIDYVTIASPGNATDFGDLTIVASSHDGCSGSPS